MLQHQESCETEILLSHRKYHEMIGKRIELAGVSLMVKSD